jgi:hypothetical protein
MDKLGKFKFLWVVTLWNSAVLCVSIRPDLIWRYKQKHKQTMNQPKSKVTIWSTNQPRSKQPLCQIWAAHSHVVEDTSLLGNYVMLSGNSYRCFKWPLWFHPQDPAVQKDHCAFETSVTTNQSTRGPIPRHLHVQAAYNYRSIYFELCHWTLNLMIKIWIKFKDKI